MEEAAVNVRKERDDKAKVFNQHADLVNQYNDLIVRYEKLLQDAETARRDAERDANAATGEISVETAGGTNLEHYLEATNKSSHYHQNQVEALKADFKSFSKHYEAFISQLNKFVQSQNDEAARLKKNFEVQSKSITELQGHLSASAIKIVELHALVDKNNAANLNAKLSTLIGTLVDVDKTRRTSQNDLENSQENWSFKVRTFLDEAARASRENANHKRAKEVENLLIKLDRLNRERNEIALKRDEMEAKVVTDRNRDVVNENFEKELEGLNLKLRWANDEIVKTHGDIQDVLRLLATKKGFITDQEDQIRLLKEELTTIIRERIGAGSIDDVIRALDEEIAKLRAEIEDLNRRIAELEDAIGEKDAEIEELNRILKERLNRIKELEALLKGSKYVAIKGDLVDELLAQYIQNCPVPVKRLGGGFYLFGLKKIFAKILNGKLVIRVGGGYMVIDKFIETYADQELIKLKKVAEREGVSDFTQLDLEMIALGPKVPLGNSPSSRSPTGKSPRTTFNASGNASINGTNRKTFSGAPKAIVKSSGTTETVVTTERIKKQA
jgi:chromosome segregation ATPase